MLTGSAARVAYTCHSNLRSTHLTFSRAASMSATPSQFMLRPTRIALVQLGQIGNNKSFNLEHARQSVLRAAQGGIEGRSNMVILPECFNSPYGVDFFQHYAEPLTGLYNQVKEKSKAEKAVGGSHAWLVDNKDNTEPIRLSSEQLERSESLRMLSSVAKESGVVLVGGSIPERDDATGQLYNTALVIDKEGTFIGNIPYNRTGNFNASQAALV